MDQVHHRPEAMRDPAIVAAATDEQVFQFRMQMVRSFDASDMQNKFHISGSLGILGSWDGLKQTLMQHPEMPHSLAHYPATTTLPEEAGTARLLTVEAALMGEAVGGNILKAVAIQPRGLRYDSDPSVASAAASGALRLFRMDEIVPRRRRYPTTEPERHAQVRKEMQGWTYEMAKSILRYFGIMQLARSRHGQGGICMKLIEDSATDYLTTQSRVLCGSDAHTRALKVATCSALASMDAEDFFGLTLLASHRQQLIKLGVTGAAENREDEELVIALKRALCKLHQSLATSYQLDGSPNTTDASNHWHWDILNFMTAGEHFADLQQPGHSLQNGEISYGDMHKFAPIPPGREAQRRPTPAELMQAVPGNQSQIPPAVRGSRLTTKS